MKKKTKAPAKKKPVVKRINWKRLSSRQAAATIGELLRKQGMRPVLVGAAAAAIYVPSLSSDTLEFVVPEYHVDVVEKLMKSIGFQSRELRSFRSDTAPVEIIFLAPPVTVGDELVDVFQTVKSKTGPLTLLTPTDCVRHRLAQWYRFGAEEALREAIAVAKVHTVNYEMIRRWSEREWSEEKYKEFLHAIS